MKKLLVAIMIILSGCDLRSSDSYLKEAAKLEDKGDFEKSLMLLNKAIISHPNSIKLLLSRGADEAALNQNQAAVNDYRRVLILDPKNTLAMYNAGNNYRRLKQYKKAIELYNAAFKTKGGATLYLDLVPNAFVGPEFAEFDVHGCEIAYQRALTYYSMDSLKAAFYDFKNAANGGCMVKESYYKMGIIFKIYNQKVNACRCFTKAAIMGDENSKAEFDRYCQQ